MLQVYYRHEYQRQSNNAVTYNLDEDALWGSLPSVSYTHLRRGEIKNFTGISAPFEAPEHPALSLDTSKLRLVESVNTLLEFVHPIVGQKGEKI